MPELRNIKLKIAYDGTDFCGWQRQDSDGMPRTVQGIIEKALEKMHGHHIDLFGSGRTDAGVHAAGQAANFYTDIQSIAPQRFTPALNNLLPRDVRILSSDSVHNDFHARFDACKRTYRYFFIAASHILPHENRYNIILNHYPNLDILNAYCRYIHGEHDFTMFASSKDTSKSFNRYIYNAVFFMESGRLIFEISANAFLRKMVRSLAGTFLFYEKASLPPESFRKIIEQNDRSLAGPTMPPQGLFLWRVDYTGGSSALNF